MAAEEKKFNTTVVLTADRFQPCPIVVFLIVTNLLLAPGPIPGFVNQFVVSGLDFALSAMCIV